MFTSGCFIYDPTSMYLLMTVRTAFRSESFSTTTIPNGTDTSFRGSLANLENENEVVFGQTIIVRVQDMYTNDWFSDACYNYLRAS